MKSIQLLLVALFLLHGVFAQTQPVLDGANSITIAELRDHMYYLASDELEGRKSGTPGYDKAAEYAVSQFRQAGITPLIKNNDGNLTYLQTVSFEKYAWDETNTITIRKGKTIDTFNIQKNFIIFSGKPYSQTELEGELVFVGAGIREPEYGIDNYEGIDVKGKWIIKYTNFPDTLKSILPKNILNKYNIKSDGEFLGEKYARESGAIGIIIIPSKWWMGMWSAAAHALSKKVTLKNIENPENDKGNTMFLADSLFLSNLFEEFNFNPVEDEVKLNSFSLGKTKLKLTKTTTKSEFQSHNVIGIIEGTDPNLKDEFISIGGHLDHVGVAKKEVFNGADDNASGSVGVIEIAEAVAKAKPKRSVLFMLYTAEEMGLLGSYFLTENPPVQLDNIIANINLDMIGRSDGDVLHGIAPICLDSINTKLKENILRVHQKYPYVELDWAYADTTALKAESDHYSFHQKEIPSVLFNNGIHPDLHQSGDDANKIDYEYFQKNCQFVYHLIMELANSESLTLSKK